jgi:small ligand-binding sensory domain FIST
MDDAPVRAGAGLSAHPDARVAGLEAAAAAGSTLEGETPDLCVVFLSGTHLAAPEAFLEAVHESLEPRSLIGCGASGVLGGAHEFENATAASVWAGSFPNGTVDAFHSVAEPLDEGVAIRGVPDLDGASAAILLADPYSFPADGFLTELSERTPGVPVLGGVASAQTIDGATALFLDERVVEGGAVGVRLGDVEVLPCVSQGARPFGPDLTVTEAEGSVIAQLAGRPALAKLREVVLELPEEERRLVDGSLLLGLVSVPNKPEYVRGDFLVRSLIGADPEGGAVAVGTPVRAGQVVRLHARDAASADDDLRESLAAYTDALGADGAAGALLFTCNGRGQRMFGEPHHDATALAAALGGAPVAGFFAAGEIGPVGLGSFLHGFTATLAIFPR